MIDVVAVRFKKAGKLYYFDPAGNDINIGNSVIVETSRGIEFGTVSSKKQVSTRELHSELKPVLRVATGKDYDTWQNNQKDACSAKDECNQIIAKHQLEMELVEAEYTFDKSKIIFYFTADGRVDFRELVKELASVFRTRIEMRQIGVRDEAKLIDSLGQCGRKTCCSSWLGDFAPVSIKMAKEQNLSLNPTKISGACGKLSCCLNYEYDHYQKANKKMPNREEVINTPCGEALTMNSNVLKEEVTVRKIKSFNEEKGYYELEDEYQKFHISEIERL